MPRLTHIRERVHLPFQPAYCPDCAPADAAVQFRFHGCDEICVKCRRRLPAGQAVYVAAFKEPSCTVSAVETE